MWTRLRKHVHPHSALLRSQSGEGSSGGGGGGGVGVMGSAESAGSADSPAASTPGFLGARVGRSSSDGAPLDASATSNLLKNVFGETELAF